MKKINYLAMLLAAGMFAACSDTLEDATGGNNTNTPATGEGYVKVAINMPTTSGAMTRADDDNTDTGSNDVVLEDGIANEYKVNDGIIAFFQAKDSESDPDKNATFVKAYAMTNLTGVEDQEDIQVSSRVTRIQQAPLVADGNKLYALVILNPNNLIIEVTADGSLKLKDKADGTIVSKLSDLSSTKFSNQILTNYTGTSNNNFTMTSSPFSTKIGNTSDWTGAVAKTLVPVEVYDSEAEARGGDAAQIYVERVVAKVTLKGFDYDKNAANKYTMEVAENDADNIYHGDQIILNGWMLNVTNKSTYLVRNVDDFSSTGWLADGNNKKANLVGIQPVDMGADNNPYYRIYWAKDPNYDQNFATASTTEFNINTVEQGKDNLLTGWNADTFDAVENDNTRTTDHALYCLENTMDYDQQNQNQTTGLLLKTTYLVKFEGESPAASQARSFFVYGDEATKCLWDDVSVSTSGSPISGLKSLIVGATSEMEEDAKLTANDIELNSEAKGGVYTRENLDDLITIKKDGVTTDDAKAPYYDAIWSKLRDISYFYNGECYYYDALIQHFGDDTGWKFGDEYALSHLGRYGIVRNNWYEININSVSGPGKPDVEEPGPGPDDENEGYIKCSINVLSWAKRSQSVDL